MSEKILVSPSSFGKCGEEPLNLLKEKNYEVILNPYGRRLTAEETIELGKECIGIVAGVEPLNKKVLTSLKSLRCISRVGTGIQNIDLEYAKNQGIVIRNTPYGPTRAVAELTIGLIFDVLRKISLRDRKMREGIWEKQMGQLLMGKKIGIIGLGKIGKKTAELLKCFNVELYCYDIYPDGKWIRENHIKLLDLNELMKKADILTVHVPPQKDKKPLIGKNELKNMKKEAYLVNVSRGGIIDEKDLYDILEKNQIAGAAIDVFLEEPYNGPFLKLDNVVLTPHIGSYAKEARLNMEMESVNNLLEVIEDK